MNTLIHRLALALSLGIGAAAHAGVVVLYDNGPPDHNNGNNLGFAMQAEDFPLSGSLTLNTIDFWSLELPGAYRGKLSWEIRVNAGGTPGSIVASGSAMPTRSLVGSALGLDEYRNSFDVNTVLGAGSYWLVLHNGLMSENGDPNEFIWESTAANGSVRGRESFDGGLTWSTNFNEHAFVISGIPEPDIAWMLGAGLLILLSRQRRTDHASDLFA